jgi:hypothetical protein
MHIEKIPGRITQTGRARSCSVNRDKGSIPENSGEQLVQKFRMFVLAACLLALPGLSSAAPGIQTEIILKDVPIRGAIYALADWANYDVILSSELENAPVSFSGSNRDPMQVAHDLAVARGMAWARVNGINVFASKCRLNLPAARSDLAAMPAGSDRVRLSLQDASAGSVLASLADRVGLGFSGPAVSNGAVGVRVMSLPVQDVMEALSAAEGIQLGMSSNALQAASKPGAASCPKFAGSAAPPPLPTDPAACPRKQRMPSSAACTRLDYIDSSTLRMRGFLAVNTGRGWNSWALLVDEAGFVHRVRKGDYVGTHMGLVTDLDRTGLKLNEVVQGADGQLAEQERSLVLE